MLNRSLTLLFFLLLLPLSASATITAPLSRGSTGPVVTELQTLLKRQGYYTSAITGKYGGFTIDAVKAYQGVNRLPITGTVNTATAKALNTAAASTTLRRPTLSFTIIPNPVVAGKPVTMQWQSTYASSCTGPNNLKGLSGTLRSQPLYTTTPLTITCTGKGGIARSRVLAQTVGSARAPQLAQAPLPPSSTPTPSTPAPTPTPTGPTLTLTATPKNVPFGASVSITWSSTGATTCAASPTSAAHFSGLSGTFVSRQLITPTTYSMTCLAADGTKTEASVTVGIDGQTPPPDEPPQTPPPPPPPPGSGVCGSANGQSFTTKPATNLCSSGTASTVSGTGPWTWSCIGSNGRGSVGCGATKITAPPLTPVAPADVLLDIDVTKTFASYRWLWGIECNGQVKGAIDLLDPVGIVGTDLGNGLGTARFAKVSDPGDTARKVLMFRVNQEDGLVAGSPRCELTFSPTFTGKLPVNKEFWFAFGVRLQDWESSPNDQILMQWHWGNGSIPMGPFFALALYGNTLQIDTKYDTNDPPSSDTMISSILWRDATPPINSWTYFVVKAKISYNVANEPYVKVWRDGTQIIDYAGPIGLNYPGVEPYLKIGHYQWKGVGAYNVWYPPGSTKTVLYRNPALIQDPLGVYSESSIRNYVQSH